MKIPLFVRLGLGVFALGFGRGVLDAQDTTPPVLVSAASLDGTNVGVCFSEPMSRSYLEDFFTYVVADEFGPADLDAISIRPGDGSVVLRLSRPISSSFTVLIQSESLQDRAGNPLPVGATVTGAVWRSPLTLADVGDPFPAGFMTSCEPGQLAVDAGGRNIGETGDQFTYLHELRTNDFDLRVRVDGLLQVDHPTAKAGLHIRQSLESSSPFFMIYVTPTNGSNHIVVRARTQLGQGTIEYTQPPSVDRFPVWLRVQRSGRSFTGSFSRDGQRWDTIGGPLEVRVLPAVALVGLGTVSHVNGVATAAEYRDFENTLLYPDAQIAITQQPTNALTEAHQGATFHVVASVTGAPTEALVYQWQAENGPNSGVFTNAWFATASAFTIPLLREADSGTRVRALVSINGLPPVVSEPATITVSPDTVAPRAISAAGKLREIVVTFSEPLDPAFAQDPLKYTVAGFSVASAILNGTGRKVTLTVDRPQAIGSTQTLQIAGVRDLAGRWIDPNPQTIPVEPFSLARGFANQDLYFDLPGYDMASLRAAGKFPAAPDESSYVRLLEGPSNAHEDYGTRVSGFLVPPVTSNYHFFLAADDQGEFWLSTNEDPANLARLCHEPIWMVSRGFTNVTWGGEVLRNAAAPENRSTNLFPAGIPLVAGRMYYFEALAKEGGGGDNLSVAWQRQGMPLPETGSSPIPGEYLACLVPPVETSLEITLQPTNVVYDFTPRATEPAPLSVESFTTSDGAYTVLTPWPFAGPWIYDSAAGVWRADGDTPELGQVMTSRLRTPPMTITRAGVAQLTFAHRYSFEFDGFRWDGGNLRVSLNGGAYTLLGSAAFLTNGYNNTVAASSGAEIAGQSAFTQTSPDHAIGRRLTSTVALGYFGPGDTVSVEFTYSGDSNTRGAIPNWEIDSVIVTEGHPGKPPITLAVEATAFRADVPEAPILYQWQQDCGAGFTNIAGATSPQFSFIPAPTDVTCQYRAQITTIGLSVTSLVSRITVAPFELRIRTEGTRVVLSWNGVGTLQNAVVINGPWVNLNAVSNSFSAPITGARRFYRVRVP